MQQNFIDEVLRLTNEFRAQQGRKPLKLNAELTVAAQQHSVSMGNDDFFSHTGKAGDSVGQRATDAGYTWNRVGENIAAGQRSPADVVKGWINSPGHRANLLNPNFTDIGLGYFMLENDQGSVNYNTYWTQVFGAGDSVPDVAKPTPPTKEVEEPTPPPVTPEAEPAADEVPTMEDPMAEDPMMEDPMTADPTGDTPMGDQPTPNALPSIADIVAQSGGEFDANAQDFDLLLTALQTAGLTDAVSDPDADLTVLAPNDGAFIQLAQDLGFEGTDEAGAFKAIVGALTELGDGDPLPLLQDVLKYHVAPGAQTLEELKAAVAINTLLEGAELSTDGVTLMDNEPDITDPSFLPDLSDVAASNGIVQGIDRVLLPLDLPGNGMEDPAADEPMDDMPGDIDPAAPMDPMKPMEPMKPTEPMEPINPTEPMEPNFPKSLHPVVRLNFEETSGRFAIDSSTAGMNNSGYLRRDAKRIEGKIGQAVGFDGVGDVVTLKNSKDINLDIHDQRTLSMWFNADDVSADKKQVVYEEGGLARGLNVYLEDGLLNVGGWNLPKGESGWDGSWLTTETGDVASGKWHHVALVLDGSDTLQNNAMTAYLDGEEIGSMDGSQLWHHAGRIGIGNVSGKTRFEDGMGQGRRSFGFAGGVDEVAIFNDALNADQVQQLAGGMG